MIKIVVAFIFFTVSLFAWKSTISHISAQVELRMIKGHSYHKGCPVGLSELRYLRLPYRDFKGSVCMGEMIVHQEVASEVVALFAQLYKRGYPIAKMQLISDYGGSDWRSIEADNTSAFNCRSATGSKKWSKHAYGKAIDINPLENPYISRSGHISHKASLPYKKRVIRHKGRAKERAMLLGNGEEVRMFEKRGWQWGGRWKRVKDYQHFSK